MTSVKNETEMKTLGQSIGERLRGGEIIELIGDVGAGKTTFVKGLSKGLKVDDDVQSPSFTISRVYDARDGLSLHHYDFYRLGDAGVMSYELAESVDDEKVITVVEWAGTVQDVLPTNRLIIRIEYTPDGSGRELSTQAPDDMKYLAAEDK